jgi:ATP-binding protein involved in chromosome partitioning
MMDARLGELLPLERRLVFGVLAQIAVGARFLDLLGQHKGDLVIEPLDFGLQFLFESFDHTGILTDQPPNRLGFSMRTYHQLSDPDRSGLGDQIAAQRARVAKRLADVRRVIAVMSGKGGVGKSYVTAHLSRALSRGGRATGVLDADLNGPTIPRLLQVPHAGTRTADDGVAPGTGLDGVRCISMGQLLEDGRPLVFRGPAAESFVWRGAMEAASLREFLGDVAWGSLDMLLLDLPPGIQRYIELCDILGSAPPVLTVTIPTAESRDAVRRAMRAAVERGSQLLGIVENMVGGQFAGTAADDLAQEFATHVLARIPWHPVPDEWDKLADRIAHAPRATHHAP